YLFDYNEGQLDELILEKLKLWPTDKQIIQTIHHSYHLACELSESLGMIQPADLSINRNNLLTVSLYEDEVSTSYIYNDTNLADIQEIDDISSAISSASKEVDQFSNDLYDDDSSSNNIFQNGQRQLKIINQPLESGSLSILNNGDSENTLNFEFLLNQRKLHDAYCSKLLERKVKLKAPSTIKVNTISSVLPNKASHLTAYFTKNKNPEQRFIKQREKHWKENQRNMLMTLAQLHSEEIEKSKKKKTSNKKKVQSNLISIPNIQNANISDNFPLLKGDYVFVLYGETVCIGKVIALYFENYNNHCYTDEPVTNLNDISYISLQIYLPIHLNLFSDILKEGCSLLTHHLASNIIYHINKLGVLIDGNVLKLLENEKKYFDYFNREDVVQKIIF
ncbi:10213_t:CDS:2, partial [Dentiscutata heterogama]